MTGGQVIRAGLVGRGIGGSASPAIHEREARALGLELHYDLVDFDRLKLEDVELAVCLDRLAGQGFTGVNVTHPFKQKVMPLLDTIDPEAEAVGAVNCVIFDGTKLHGLNSDVSGFAFLLAHELGDARISCVAQIGAGGAGSAAAFALLSAGAGEIRLYDALHQRAQGLAQRLASSFPTAKVVVAARPGDAIEGADGIVQTTPVGMEAHPGMPFDPELVDRGQWLADIIYFPRETELVRAVKASGVRAVGGSAMVVGQASEPFRRFTGHEPDRERMLMSFLASDRAASASEVSAR